MKRALVTGASGDIGSAIAARLADEGLRVFVHSSRSSSRAEQVVARIGQRGGSAQAVYFDVRDAGAAKGVLDSLLNDGPIQVLVNNAGIHDDAPLAGMTPDQWNSVVDVALRGFYNVTQPLLLPMIQTRWGRIVSITSIAGVTGNRGQCNYSAAKSGLHGATKALAIELASRGITVNAIAPGIVAGRMTERIFDQKKLRQLVPMGRAGEPDEIADFVAYLVCGNTGYLSGQIININGAMI
jgi:3-oxoacyl-[acyl-carrier protein] reductase